MIRSTDFYFILKVKWILEIKKKNDINLVSGVDFLLIFFFCQTLIIDLSISKTSPWVLRVYCISLFKTLWEKEKLLVTSNFSFSHRGFYP